MHTQLPISRVSKTWIQHLQNCQSGRGGNLIQKLTFLQCFNAKSFTGGGKTPVPGWAEGRPAAQQLCRKASVHMRLNMSQWAVLWQARPAASWAASGVLPAAGKVVLPLCSALTRPHLWVPQYKRGKDVLKWAEQKSPKREWGNGSSALWGEAERDETLQPEAEKAYGILYICVNAWSGERKITESDPPLWCPVKGKRTQTNMQGIPLKHK